MPAKWAHLGIATDWSDTPAELIDMTDLASLEKLLPIYLQEDLEVPTEAAGGSATKDGLVINQPSNIEILRVLVPSYGVSNHEGPVREDVKKLLPTWAKPDTDEAGNLILKLDTAPAESKAPPILVSPHTA